MKFLILDTFGLPALVADEDGIPLEFQNEQDTIQYAEENLQRGYYSVISKNN